MRVPKDLLVKRSKSLSFKSRLAKVLFYYRCVPHCITQKVLSVVLNSRKYITLKDRINPNFCHADDNVCTKNVPTFDVGNQVLAKNVSNGPKWYKGTVVQKLTINMY